MAVTSLQRIRRQAVFGGVFLPLVAFFTLFDVGIVHAEQQSTRIELQVITAPTVGPLAPQEWLAVLQKLPLDNIRIRTGTGREKPLLERGERTIRVTGVLSARNTLLLPGKQVRLRDRAGLANWLDELIHEGDAVIERFAFGLTAEQLIGVHDALRPRLPSSTKNRNTMEVVDELTELMELPAAFSTAARAGLHDGYPVADELQGLSSGTALAAVLRPVGLVFYPHDSGRSLVIVTSSEYEQAWPIGWPPEKKSRDVAPVFFRKLEIEIDDTPLSDVVQSLRQRMEMPIVFDQNGMARQRIKPDEIRIVIPKRRTFYKRALDLALRQARLRAELRVDEAERPFIWVSPSRVNADVE